MRKTSLRRDRQLTIPVATPLGFAAPSTYIIEGIVDRCHVGRSLPYVLRYVRSRMNTATRYGREWKMWRKSAYRIAIARHNANLRFYAAVMSGRLTTLED